MRFPGEIIAEYLAGNDHQPLDNDAPETHAENIITALGAEGYAIVAGHAPPSASGGSKVEVQPAKMTNKSRTQGDK